MPGADARFEVEEITGPNTLVRVYAEHLAPPARVAPGANHYIVWFDEDQGLTQAGRLEYDEGERTGEMRATSPDRSFTVLVTAESSRQVRRPSRTVVFEQRVARQVAQPGGEEAHAADRVAIAERRQAVRRADVAAEPADGFGSCRVREQRQHVGRETVGALQAVHRVAAGEQREVAAPMREHELVREAEHRAHAFVARGRLESIAHDLNLIERHDSIVLAVDQHNRRAGAGRLPRRTYGCQFF